MNNILNFNVEHFKFERLLDDDTALLKIKVCSSGMNLHEMPFTAETLKRAAETSLRGKPIVGCVQWSGDLGGHEKPEESNIIGYVVENQDFEYVENEDGTTSLFCYAILWKVYCPYEYNAIVKGINSIKGVSMEIEYSGMEKGWEGNDEINQITDFSFRSICILGDLHTPASPGAYAQMVVFSKKVKETEMKYFSANNISINNSKESATNKNGAWSNPGRKLYSKLLKASNSKALVDEAYLIVEDGYEDTPSTSLKYPHHSIVNGELVVNVQGLQTAFSRASQQHIVSGKVKAHLLRHYRELGLDMTNFTEKEDEVEMATKKDIKEEEEKKNQKMNAETENKEKETKMEANSEDMSCKMEKETFEDDEDKKEDTSKEEKENNDDKEDEEKVDYEAKCDEYENKIAEMEENNKAFMKELEELRKYKADKEEAERNFKAASLFDEVMDILPKEKYDALKEESKSVENKDFEAFSNKVKALCFTLAVPNKKIKKENRMAINTEEIKTEKKFW